MLQYLKILFSRLYLLAAEWKNIDTQPYYCDIPAGYREERSHVTNQYPILCDIYWISTGIILNQSHVTLFDRADTLVPAGKATLTSGLLLGRSAEVSVEELETLPAGSHGYHTIIDRLDKARSVDCE